MARKPDWLHVADALDTERQAMQDRCPPGVECSLTLSAYGFSDGARYAVTLTHGETKLGGYGCGSTPAKALAAAKENMAKNAAERAKRPVLAAGNPLALTTKGAS